MLKGAYGPASQGLHPRYFLINQRPCEHPAYDASSPSFPRRAALLARCSQVRGGQGNRVADSVVERSIARP